jgi:glutamine synthetase
MAKVAKFGDAISQHDFLSIEEYIQFCAKTFRPFVDQVRQYADALEGEIADELWPFSNYQEKLFLK